MPTLGELAEKFGQAAGEGASTETTTPAADGGETKLASEEGQTMNSLASIYLKMSDMDKTASAAAEVPADETDYVKVAEQLAAAEAAEQAGTAAAPEGEGNEIIKVAAEYDAAGRIMARGFFDEFNKLASSIRTSDAGNTNAYPGSVAKTPALGERKKPHVENNYVGDGRMDTAGAALGKDTYKESLKTKKKVGAGVTGDDPEAAAISVGGGSPAGFATIRDLVG